MIRIAIDAMGGDFGPEPIIEGVVQALEEKQFMPILVGDKTEILSYLPQYYINKVKIVEASDVISMSDQATNALKRKESSIYKAVELVRNKEADAVVSAGHSGATMTLATLRMGRLPHISKPALATLMPSTTDSKTLVLGCRCCDRLYSSESCTSLVLWVKRMFKKYWVLNLHAWD